MIKKADQEGYEEKSEGDEIPRKSSDEKNGEQVINSDRELYKDIEGFELLFDIENENDIKVPKGIY